MGSGRSAVVEFMSLNLEAMGSIHGICGSLNCVSSFKFLTKEELLLKWLLSFAAWIGTSLTSTVLVSTGQHDCLS